MLPLCRTLETWVLRGSPLPFKRIFLVSICQQELQVGISLQAKTQLLSHTCHTARPPCQTTQNTDLSDRPDLLRGHASAVFADKQGGNTHEFLSQADLKSNPSPPFQQSLYCVALSVHRLLQISLVTCISVPGWRLGSESLLFSFLPAQKLLWYIQLSSMYACAAQRPANGRTLVISECMKSPSLLCGWQFMIFLAASEKG